MYGYKQAKKENGCIVKCNHQFFFSVSWIGFEPMAYCLEGSCSIQLSYQDLCVCFPLKCEINYYI